MPLKHIAAEIVNVISVKGVLSLKACNGLFRGRIAVKCSERMANIFSISEFLHLKFDNKLNYGAPLLTCVFLEVPLCFEVEKRR